jgi:endonuclease YncB( thermonuclease family)
MEAARAMLASHGDETPEFSLDGTQVWARVVDIHDGDTLKVTACVLGLTRKFTLRLAGIDAPEVWTHDAAEKAAGLVSRDYVVKRLGFAPGDACVCIVQVNFHGFDKYGRVLSDVYPPGKTESLSQEMMRLGLAKAYDGGHKS